MHISKKSEYALKALISISQHNSSRPVQITELSESERIPVKFLEQILLALRKADILVSKRGVGGGYLLHKSSDQITVGEVIRLMDGPILPVPEDDDPRSAMRMFMEKLRSDVVEIVDGVTIDDITAMGRGQDGMFFDI